MDSPHVDERDLIQRARGGDHAAFATLVQRHRRRLWSVCYRVCENHTDAEDALQDCLLSAWHNLASFRGESGIGTWLYRIASNAALAITRRRRPEVTLDHTEPFSLDFSQAVVGDAALAAALRTLPVAFREALVLRIVADFSYDQIARHQQINVQTVKSRISRGRAQLRLALSQAEQIA